MRRLSWEGRSDFLPAMRLLEGPRPRRTPTLDRPLRHLGFLAGAILPSWIVFEKLCRLHVHCDEWPTIQRNTLIAANHRSLIDGHLVSLVLFHTPGSWRHYHRLPYHAAAAENYLNTPLKRFFFGFCSKCLPAYRDGNKEQVFASLDNMTQHLREGTLHYCPEGTRTRNGKTLSAKWGIGYIAYHARPTVIPVFHQGTERILPVGATRLSFGHDIHFHIGRPLSLDRFYSMPDTGETWTQIAEAIMEPIREMELAFTHDDDRRRAA
jgi:1-acyl-sn-glycerol-3-phosphate acyltransferase